MTFNLTNDAKFEADQQREMVKAPYFFGDSIQETEDCMFNG